MPEDFDADLARFAHEFVVNVQGSSYHPKWVRANPGEASKWAALRDALVADPDAVPVVPLLSTRYGKALVAAAELHMSVSRILGIMHGTGENPSIPPSEPPPSGIPAQPPNGWTTTPLFISAGGIYDGTLTGIGWESLSSGAPAVTVATPQPVTIKGWVRNLAGGRNIHATSSQAQITIDHAYIYGGSTYQTSHRWFEAVNFRTIVISNCTIENTRGIQLEGGIADSSVLITRCKHLNIQGNGTNPVGNFVQFRECVNPTLEVSWNEITNHYNLSNPEDIVSIYHTSNTNIHDNLFRWQSSPGNPSSSSQGGITMDQSTIGGGGQNNIIQDNQLIGTEPILIYATTGGDNNSVLDNRIVDSGLLEDGVTTCNTRGLGIHVLTGGSNNRATGNVVGVTHNGSRTVDWRLEGCPGGDTSEGPNNTHMPGAITHQTELAEYALWLQKLVTNDVTIGA